MKESGIPLDESQGELLRCFLVPYPAGVKNRDVKLCFLMPVALFEHGEGDIRD
jgi:hypothetical protein